MTIEQVLNLDNNTIVTERFSGTVTAVYDTESRTFMNKMEEYQNIVIEDGTGSIKVKLMHPSKYIPTDSVGCVMTFTPGTANGGPSAGQPCGLKKKSGIAKSTGNAWVMVEATAKAITNLEAGGSAPAQNRAPNQSNRAPAQQRNTSMPEIPFEMYVKDFHATMERVEKLLPEGTSTECIVHSAINAIISHRNQYPLFSIKVEDGWSTWVHPKAGKTFKELWDKKPEKVIQDIVLTDVMPRDMLLKALESLEVPQKDIAEALITKHEYSQEALFSFLDNKGIEGYAGLLNASDNHEEVKTYEPKPPFDTEVTTTVEDGDGWD